MTPAGSANLFRVALWQAVTRINQRLHIAEYRLDTDVIAVLREHHASLRAGLNRLVLEKFLVSDVDGHYWFEAGCAVPADCEPPLHMLQPNPSARAGVREHTAMAMPIAEPAPAAPQPPQSADRFRFLELPSRLCDTLRWRDGRITDLQGNPIEAASAK